MAGWKLTVWSRYRASAEQVWQHKTDPEWNSEELGPLFRLVLKDAQGFAAAAREGRHGSFRARLTGPLGVVGLSWPVELRQSRPPTYFRDASRNLLFREWQHEHRVEPTPAGRVRYVDELIFEPAAGGFGAAQFTRALFVHRHYRAARHLQIDGDALAHSWLRPALGMSPVMASV
jgi:hypothetical protein